MKQTYEKYLPPFVKDTREFQILAEIESPILEEERKAKVVCVVVYYENGEFLVAEGEIEGKIAKEPRGDNGFGFDPIFELENGKTYAELSKKEKNTISHRKRALENLEKQLTNK